MNNKFSSHKRFVELHLKTKWHFQTNIQMAVIKVRIRARSSNYLKTSQLIYNENEEYIDKSYLTSNC